MNYEDFGENYKWQSTAATRGPNRPVAWGSGNSEPANKPVAWGSGNTESTNKPKAAWGASPPAREATAAKVSPEPSSDDVPIMNVTDISTPQLLSKPNPIVAKKKFHVDPIETSKPNPNPPKSKKQLPPNWEEAQTEGGETYYYNIITNESSWELPTDSQVRKNKKKSLNVDTFFSFKSSEPICPTCGKAWATGTVFCGDCGTRIS